MTDTVTKKKRSEIMRTVRSKGSLMEVDFKRQLEQLGYKFKTNFSKLLGKPDIAFPRKRLVIFLDSCFWHGCKRHCRLPQANRKYWKAKIGRNKERDAKVNKFYKKTGWKVLRFWEHEIKKNKTKIIEKIDKSIK